MYTKRASSLNCGCVNHDNFIVKNGTRTSRMTLNQVSGLPAFLKLRKQRFFCRECSHSFTADTTSIVDRNGFISKHVKNEIKVKACDTVSESHIAKEMNVSVHTVRRVVNETADSLRINPLNELPEHMCWDEFKNVKTISIDMYAPYIEVIKRLFPKAKIIIDSFHIIQALNRELNKTRTRKMNQVCYKDRRLYNKLKRYWKLILKNRDELQSYNYKYYRLFDWLTHSQGEETLVRTETTFYNNLATLDTIKDLGGEYYEIVAVLDTRTSDICRHENKKIYPISEYKAGQTAPPFHVRCRSTIMPSHQSKDGEKSDNPYVDILMNEHKVNVAPSDKSLNDVFDEWEREGKAIKEKLFEIDRKKMYNQSMNRNKNVNKRQPVNITKQNELLRGFKDSGGFVWQDEEALSYLKNQGVDACCLDHDTIVLQKNL